MEIYNNFMINFKIPEYEYAFEFYGIDLTRQEYNAFLQIHNKFNENNYIKNLRIIFMLTGYTGINKLVYTICKSFYLHIKDYKLSNQFTNSLIHYTKNYTNFTDIDISYI